MFFFEFYIFRVYMIEILYTLLHVFFPFFLR